MMTKYQMFFMFNYASSDYYRTLDPSAPVVERLGLDYDRLRQRAERRKRRAHQKSGLDAHGRIIPKNAACCTAGDTPAAAE